MTAEKVDLGRRPVPGKNRLFVRRLANPIRTKGLKSGLIIPFIKPSYIHDLPQRARRYVDLSDQYWLGEVLAIASPLYQPDERANWRGPMHLAYEYRIPEHEVTLKIGDLVILDRYAGDDLEHLHPWFPLAEDGEQICAPLWYQLHAIWRGTREEAYQHSVEQGANVSAGADEPEAVDEQVYEQAFPHE